MLYQSFGILDLLVPRNRQVTDKIGSEPCLQRGHHGLFRGNSLWHDRRTAEETNRSDNQV